MRWEVRGMTRAMKAWLSEHGLTATDIARALGWKDTTMYYVLAGHRAPPSELHDILCNVYGMTEEEFKGAMK